MKFYTMQNRPPKRINNSGSGFRDVIKRQTDKNGKIFYGKISTVNVYEKIQEGKEDTLVYNILERFKNGDLTVLQKSNGVYADTTGMPDNINDANKLTKNAVKNFEAMPDLIKQKILNGENITREDLESIVNPKVETQTQSKEEQVNE